MVETTCADVLVVEDHGDTAEMIQRTLRRRGVSADVARTSADALARLERMRPQCIIIDEAMPDMTGLQLLQKLRGDDRWRKLPVYFYTASFEARKQLEAERLGARGWYVKGVSRLGDLVDSVLESCGKN